MSNQTRQFNIVVLINKAKDNDNITFSITESEQGGFLHANMTGSVVEANGLVHTEDSGAEYDYSGDIKGLEALILVDKLILAEKIINEAEAIFTKRAERNDLNNRVYLNIVASGFRLDIKDEAEEADDNRSKLWITNIISVDITGGLSIDAFKNRLNALKSRSANRRVKTRSNGLFRPQQEVAKTTTENIDVPSNDAPPELPSREEMFKQMMVMQEQMAQMQSKLAAKSSSSNGGSKAPVVRDVKALVEN
ncbi:hypothetical protein [Pleurocapsa sp. PCC 7319]|uniref:hypothetical protein n=1 Tax=Pleurocapsa sp. PCC 7319 TaxID=118161 RepID=UPI000346BBB9|nr:hypothetical protein [Pleurocapsa sp. PCC 7319]